MQKKYLSIGYVSALCALCTSIATNAQTIPHCIVTEISKTSEPKKEAMPQEPMPSAAPEKENEIPLTEDLMREHGLLNRVLLIYEEIIKRINTDTAFSVKTLEQAVDIIKRFVEDYHEKMEEDYLFPLFEQYKKEVRLVRTLKTQHTRGREITSKIQSIITGKSELDTYQKRTVKALLQKFIDMYRPHEAREDTILFPLVRSLMSEKEFEELGEKFDDLEHKLFGKDGFEMMVGKVAGLEKELGIYELEKFTPELPLKE